MQWQWNGPLLAFCLIALPLTLAAGCWQLRRAEEKRELLAAFDARAQQAPVALAEVDPAADHRYLRVSVAGRPDQRRQFLLDNRMRDGRAGYEVLTPVQFAERRWVLVNRGWLPRGVDRTRLPDIPRLADRVALVGQLHPLASGALVLGPEDPAAGWPQVIQQSDPQLLEQRLGVSLFPYQVRLEDSPGFVTGWVTTSLSPAQHRGYAVQWFALAVALVVLGLFANSNLPEWLRSVRRRRDG